MLLKRSDRFWCILGCLIEDGCNNQEGWKNPKMVIAAGGGGGQKMYQNVTENAMVSYSFYLQASKKCTKMLQRMQWFLIVFTSL